MTALHPNCLSEGETLADLVRRDHVSGIDIRFNRQVEGADPDDRFTEECDPSDAEIITIYGINDLGEAIAIHDSPVTPAGAAEISAMTFRAISAIMKGAKP